MARLRIEDWLQNNRFWLVDINPTKTPPFFVLGGVTMGFNSITMPEISFQTEPIAQYNANIAEHIYTGREVGSVTLTRGSKFYDSSFNEWANKVIEGNDVFRRDLLLIQYSGVNLDRMGGLAPPQNISDGNTWMIGKAWFLYGALPTRYKPSGDLDATSAEVSIMEIDLALHDISEVSLSAAEVGSIMEATLNYQRG